MKDLVKLVLILILMSFLFACSLKKDMASNFSEWKEGMLERVKVVLSDIPIVKRWVRLPPPPKELYRETEAKIALLKLSRAKDLFADEYGKVLKEWDLAKKDYERKLYKRAERKLKKTHQASEELLKKVEDEEKRFREEALRRYKEKEATLLAKLSKDEEKNLKIRLYLWKLRNLLDLGRFDEFERELEKSPI